MKLYTTYIDYFATGEGRTVFLNISYAHSEEEMIAKMKSKIGELYGDYYIKGVEVEEGFNPKNRYVKMLLSSDSIKQIKKGGGYMDTYVEHHFNLS